MTGLIASWAIEIVPGAEPGGAFLCFLKLIFRPGIFLFSSCDIGMAINSLVKIENLNIFASTKYRNRTQIIGKTAKITWLPIINLIVSIIQFKT